MDTATASSPIRRYMIRVSIAMTLYIVMLIAADLTIRRIAPQGPLRYMLAIVPALPVIAVFWALGRYLVEQHDEYLRMLMVRQILYATGFTLAVATAWGFLSALAEVPPLRHFAVLWFAGFGLAAIVVKVQEG